MEGNYDDILNLPHHVSALRPRMPLKDRAAQFAPFAALSGYAEAVDAMREKAEAAAEPCRVTEEYP